jgi:hypothetical protein
MKLAVPTSTAFRSRHHEFQRVPGRKNTPHADNGIETLCATCQTIRSATGFTAGPDSRR